MQRDVTTWYLETLDPADLRAARPPDVDVRIVQAEIPSPELHRFLYTAVGGDWFWTERIHWDYERWRAWVERPELEVWVAYVAGTPAGYAELERQEGGNVEIVHFGLLTRFVGRGIGGHLLTWTIRHAWELGARRVWVHTCSMDGPHALANYRARGMRVFRETVDPKELPEKTPGPWPGARP